MKALYTWQDELKRWITSIIACSTFFFGLTHLLSGLGVGANAIKSEGIKFEFVEGVVLMVGALLLQRGVSAWHKSKPRLDETMTHAIRERAVDNLIEAQRKTHGGQA